MSENRSNFFSYKLTFPPDTITNDSIVTDTIEKIEYIYVYDTLYQYDTIYQYDTVYQNVEVNSSDEKYLKSPIFLKLNSTKSKRLNDQLAIWSTGIHYSFVSYESLFQNKYPEYINHYNLRKNNEQTNKAFSFGGDVKYYKNKWSIKLGLAYSGYENKYAYPYTNTNYDTTYTWDVTSQSFWQNDTIDSYYQIIGGDTIWHHVITQIYVTEYDSTQITNIDSLISNHELQGKHNFTYFEVPIILGWKVLEWKKTEINMQVGIISSFLIHKKGTLPSINDQNKFIEFKDYNYSNTFFSGIGGINLVYNYSDKFAIELNAFKRFGITSLINENNPILHKFDSQGISLGFRYKW